MINNDSLRVTGLASGMNTDEIVQKLVNAQSARLNKMIANKTLSTWKSDAYRDVNKKIDEFRKATEGLRLQSTFSKQKVSSNDSSKLEVSMAGTSTRTEFVISSATPATIATPAVVSFDSKNAKVDVDTTFKLNGVPIILETGMPLDEVVAEINKYTTREAPEISTNVKAANVGGSLVFTSVGTGIDVKINITDVTTTLSNPLNIANSSDTGENASSGSVKINDHIINISSNTFNYEGVAFTIKAPITSNVSVQISQDTQGMFDSIKTFVDKYNELISDLNGRLSEKRYRDFPPLSDDQKKDMKENDIKLWEEKAKSGLLTNDSTIETFLSQMRNSLIQNVNNAGVSKSFDSLKEIGLDFSTNYYENGKIIIDEAKLKGVLETNLEEVKKLFTKKNSETSGTTVTNKSLHDESGFAWRIYDRLNVAITQLGTLAGSPNSKVDTQSFMAKQIKSLESNISREQRKIDSYEQRLWKQFSAMESALSRMNSQSSWLSQQLGM